MIRLLIVIGLALAGLYAWQTSTGRAPWTQEMAVNGMGVPIDGDSLRLNGQEIRLQGLDSPEYGQTCERMGREVACGREATAALRRLLARAPATCIGSGQDRYGRLLARCRVLGVDIGAQLVREGHAVANGDYLAEEAEARADNRGLWSGRFDSPREWRAKHPRPPRGEPAGAQKGPAPQP